MTGPENNMAPIENESIPTKLEPFLRRLLQLARFDVTFRFEPGENREPDAESPQTTVNFSGPDADLLLQRGGELLEALEHVAVKFLRLSAEGRAQVSFDCLDYKSLRSDELRLTAETAAERVQRTGQPFALNPMNSRERRIVHLALRDHATVRTESQGGGPFRKVVIFPAEKK